MSKDRTWFLVGKKLAGEASADELNELEALLRSDPDMHYALQNITDLWNLPHAEHNGEAEEDAFQRHINRLKAAGGNWEDQQAEQQPEAVTPTFTKPRYRKIGVLIGTAAAILVVVTGIYFYSRTKPATAAGPFIAHHSKEKSEISTRNGSRTKITLPDGSKVWLNAGSKLTYNKDFGNETREVDLTGEAFFDVVPSTSLRTGARIPFIIHTQQIDVRVLGTAFNVKSYPGDRQTETSLVRGKVEVFIHNRSDEKIILRPNEKLVVLNDEAQQTATTGKTTNINPPIVTLSKLTYTPADSLLVETAWVENKLVFDNESFSEVAAKMERWYNVQFKFIDSQKQAVRLTGEFENETIQQALDAMRVTTPFHYTITGNTVTIER